MNSLTVALISILVFGLGYEFYRRKLTLMWDVSETRKTPALTKYNGADYVPSKNWLFLFGHHFSSIAGAGPILGPVIACVIWGWLPAVLWVVLGSVFIGGVHDFSALMISVRNEGSSIADISEKVLGQKAKIFFSVFVFLALILVIAAFAVVTAKTFISTPQIVIPTFGLIGVAVIFGFMIYKWNVNSFLATAVSLAVVALLILLGNKYPLGLRCANPKVVWILILFVYAGAASVAPVNLLLQPRDYLSSFFLFAGLIAGYAGLIFSHPHINAPAIATFNSVKGLLWPTMFIIIACGANSGFHSLVSSGTTSKQLSNEKYAFRIGYGAMIAEGALAILAILAVTAGLKWEGCNSYPALMRGGDWIGTFAAGFGEISRPVMGVYGSFFAMLFLNAFEMTTLDTATRITRYVGQELFGSTFKIKILGNSIVMTVFIVVLAYWFSTGPQARVWPVFGASNQLIAALVLLIIAAWLFFKGKASLFVFVPGVFMLVTTFFALLIEVKHNFGEDNLLFAISSLLLIMTVFMVYETVKKFIKIKEYHGR